MHSEWQLRDEILPKCDTMKQDAPGGVLRATENEGNAECSISLFSCWGQASCSLWLCAACWHGAGCAHAGAEGHGHGGGAPCGAGMAVPMCWPLPPQAAPSAALPEACAGQELYGGIPSPYTMTPTTRKMYVEGDRATLGAEVLYHRDRCICWC